jgi:hypothetical protein
MLTLDKNHVLPYHIHPQRHWYDMIHLLEFAGVLADKCPTGGHTILATVEEVDEDDDNCLAAVAVNT